MAGAITKKHRKHGRNALSCTTYKNTNRREKNKIVRINRHLARHPRSEDAIAAVARCKKLIRGF
jgi:hypothetical protein